jgi:hypothetical protein
LIAGKSFGWTTGAGGMTGVVVSSMAIDLA